MLLHVQYQNDKFDYVQASALDALISSGHLKKLYRPMDKRWATIGIDAVRGGGGSYAGPERRRDTMAQ